MGRRWPALRLFARSFLIWPFQPRLPPAALLALATGR
jgi:hypothetical protein